MASSPGQSGYDPYNWSSDGKEYLMPDNVAKTTPERSDCAARLLTATRIYLNSPPELPQYWGQINPNYNDYHSNTVDISSTLWLPDITDWWLQHEEMYSTYGNLCDVARDIFSIIPHGVRVEGGFSLGRDVIPWRQSKPPARLFTNRSQ